MNEIEDNLKCTLAGLLVDDLPWEFETWKDLAVARLRYWNSVIEVQRDHKDALRFVVLRGGTALDSYKSLKTKKNQNRFRDYCMTARAARGLVKKQGSRPSPVTPNRLINEIDSLLKDPKPSSVTHNTREARRKLKQLKELIKKGNDDGN